MPDKNDNDVARFRARALFRASNRGTREMDFLLGRFAKAEVAGMGAGELAVFERLMALPEPVLTDAILNGTGQFEDDIAVFLQRIRKFHKDRVLGVNGQGSN